MNFGSSDWRHRRTFLHQGMHLHPFQYSILNYSTESIDKKYPIEDISCPLTEGGLLDKLNSIPDPLKKNLADSVAISEEKAVKNKKMSLEVEEFYYETDLTDDSLPGNMKTKETTNKSDFYPSLTGIAGFFTSFFGAISGAMFQKRPKSPVSQYYDCFDDFSHDDRQGEPTWQCSKDENKNKISGEQFSSCNGSMNNCRAAVVQCESKLSAVKNLLTSKTVPVTSNTPKLRQRRPRRVFIEPNSVEENCEDVFASDEYISVENEEYVEYFTIPRKCDSDLGEIDAPKTKIEIAPENIEIVKEVTELAEKTVVNNSSEEPKAMPESMEVVKTLTEVCLSNQNIDETGKKSLEKPEAMPESTEVVKTLSEDCVSKYNGISNTNVIVNSIDSKEEIISSCEDKIAKLKSLLQGKKKKPTIIIENQNSSISQEIAKEDTKPKKPTKSIPIEKVLDKHFKNPHRLSTDKRKKCRLKKTIQEDILFANELDSEDISSVENSPKTLSMERLKSSEESLSETPDDSFKEKEYFDEVKGRFHSSSTTDSEDSFQIVFADSPKLSRIRRPSDCDSEDSFIVFEDSPDSCYTSHEVFREESNESGNESDSEFSDSGLDVCKLSHSLSRTVSDLTDNSLYEETDKNNNGCDELDCAVRTVCEELLPQNIVEVNSEQLKKSDEVADEEKQGGLLLDEARKLKKKNQPPKKVTFSPAPPTVRVMRVWAFAARQARAGHWERYSRDAERFKRRIADVDMAISWVLKPAHRKRVMFQRFMPWWHQQRRKEAEEKKRREQEEKERKEREEKERLEREERERIQREKEEAEEMKRLEMELREERKRADRERMERRLQQKLLEKEQDRLIMEEEERQKRFLEASLQDQIDKEKQQENLTEETEEKTIEVKPVEEQKELVVFKEQPIQNTELKIQETSKQQTPVSKDKIQTVDKKEVPQKKESNQQIRERKRLGKEKIEKFQQQQKDEEQAFKDRNALGRRRCQQENIEILSGNTANQQVPQTQTAEDLRNKQKTQTQIENNQEIAAKTEQSEEFVKEIVVKPQNENEKFNDRKVNIIEQKIELNETTKVSNKDENLQNNAKELDKKENLKEKQNLSSTTQVTNKKQNLIREDCSKIGGNEKKDTAELQVRKEQQQHKTELNKEDGMKTENNQQETKKENINLQEKSKVGANRLDSTKKSEVVNTIVENNVGNVSNDLNVKEIVEKDISDSIPSGENYTVVENNVGNVINDFNVKEIIEKDISVSYNNTVTNIKKTTATKADKLKDTRKSQTGVDRCETIKISVNGIENAPDGKDTTDNMASNGSINNLDHKNKLIKPPDSVLTINNKEQTHKIKNTIDNTQSLNFEIPVINNIDKAHIGIENIMILPSHSKVVINNIEKVNTNINNKPSSSKSIVNNIDKKSIGSKLSNSFVDKTDVISPLDSTPTTNSIDSKQTIDNTTTIQPQISIDKIETKDKIEGAINKPETNETLKTKNNKPNSLYETQKERRNRRINKKLMFLRDQLAEIQRDLSNVTESVSGN